MEIEIKEEGRRSLEENSRAMRDVQRKVSLQKYHELEKQDSYFKRELEIDIEEEEKKSLEDNRRAMRDVQRRVSLQKDYELEKQDNYFKREHVRLLADARVFIEKDERSRTKEITDYVESYYGNLDFNLVALIENSRDISLVKLKCIVVWGDEYFTVE